MINEIDFARQYQIRTTGCGSRYQLADKLLKVYGYREAVNICRKNHWNGVIQSIRIIQEM